MFTGTLIEDLMATVERAEQSAQSGDGLAVDSWFASAQENTACDAKLLGAA